MSIRRYSLAIALAFGASAFAGPEWMEMGESGSVPGNAQATTGNGALAKISGTLSGPGAGPKLGAPGATGDFQDMYLIKIVDPLNFRATTLPGLNGGAEFDAQLFLFTPDGLGLVANLDATAGTTDPLLLPDANDGTGAIIDAPGLYLLAISGFPSFPRSINGPIFEFDLFQETSGPDGNGGSQPIIGWNGPGQFGQYEIALTGAELIPVNELGCDPADIAEPFGEHNFSDIILFLSEYSAGVLDLTDLAAPFGVLNFSDVIAFLTEFADGC